MSVPFDRTAVSALTRTTTTATATVVSTAALKEGQFVLIEGALPDAYNGMKSIHIVNATTFTYAIDNDAAITSPASINTLDVTSIYYRGAAAPYVPFLGQTGPYRLPAVSYHSTALEDNVAVVAEGRTVTSFYGTTVATVDRFIYVFDSATIPADGNLVTQTAIPGLKWQIIEAFANDNFYIDVPTQGTRFKRGVSIAVSLSGDPTTFVKVAADEYHYDLEFHS